MQVPREIKKQEIVISRLRLESGLPALTESERVLLAQETIQLKKKDALLEHKKHLRKVKRSIP